MFCEKCGANNTDNDRYCKECGAPLNPASGSPAGLGSTPASGKRNRIVGIAAVALAAVVVIILLVNLLGGSSAEDVALKFMKAVLEPDSQTIFNLLPEEILQEKMGIDVSDKAAMKEQYAAIDAVLTKAFNGIEDVDISYKVVETEDVSSLKLAQMNLEYEDYGLTVTEAKNVEIQLTITQEENYITQSMTIPVVKIGGSWYLDYEGLNNIF